MLKRVRFFLQHIYPVLKNKYFIKNLLMLIIIILLLFFISTYTVNNNTRRILENELLASDRNYIELVSNSVGSLLLDMRYIAATLDINYVVNTFFSSERPDHIISDIYIRLQEKLEGYVNSYSSIDSIYLYSEKANTIITSTGKQSASAFSDLNWMEHFSEQPDAYTIFSRAENGSYPNFLCIMKQIKTGDSNAAIVINITLNNIPILSETQQRYSDIYIVNDDSQVIYHDKQRYLLEPLSVSDNLRHYSADTDERSFIVDDKAQIYTYSQLHSPDYNFSYVLITNLKNYSEELSSRQTIFFTLFFGLFLIIFILSMVMGLRFFKPIEMLTQLLNESSDFLANTEYPSKEISALADRIISYAQTNKQLADELANSLHRLNQSQILALQAQLNSHFLFNTLGIIHIKECQALGHTHPLPDMTLKLSRILRHAIDSTDMVPLQTELQYIEQYIDLMKPRSSNDVSVVYQIDPLLLETKVPKLFIQPLIENVFIHAFPEGHGAGNQLKLLCHKEDGYCIVILTDNGIGMSPEKITQIMHYLDEDTLPTANIGIRNVIFRMKLIYGAEFSLNIYGQKHEGTTFHLVFPIVDMTI